MGPITLTLGIHTELMVSEGCGEAFSSVVQDTYAFLTNNVSETGMNGQTDKLKEHIHITKVEEGFIGKRKDYQWEWNKRGQRKVVNDKNNCICLKML